MTSSPTDSSSHITLEDPSVTLLVRQLQSWLDHPSRNIINRMEDVDYCWQILSGATQHDQVNEHPASESGCRGWRFQPLRELGSGGFGIVIEALDTALNRRVALKMIRPSLSHHPKLVQRFTREAQAMAALQHPGIVQIYETTELAGTQIIVSELVEGPNLSKFLKSRAAPLDARAAAHIIEKVADAVSYAHSRGFLHRDLKPSNILLTVSTNEHSEETLQPRLTDFGLAKRFDGGEGDQESQNLTRDTQTLGTLHYMSPEQASGRLQDVAMASDVFSLGVILYQMLTARLPFQAELDYQVVQQICNAEPTSIRKLNPRVPRDLEAVVFKCLAKSMKDRYESASELVGDLRCFLAGSPVKASRPSAITKAIYWTRRSPLKATAVALLVLMPPVTTALVGGALIRERRANATVTAVLKETGNAVFPLVEKLNDGLPLTQEDHLVVLQGELAATKIVVQQQPHDPVALHRLSVLHHYMANAYSRLGRHREAYDARCAILECLDRLIEMDPARRRRYLFDKFMAYQLRAILHYSLGSENCLQLQREDFLRAKSLIEQLLKEVPDKVEYRDAYHAAQMAMVTSGIAEGDEAEQMASKLIDSSTQLWKEHPDQPRLAKYAIEASQWLAGRAMSNQNWTECLAHSRNAATILVAAFPPSERDTWFITNTCTTSSHLAAASFRTGNYHAIIETEKQVDQLDTHLVTDDVVTIVQAYRLAMKQAALSAAQRLHAQDEVVRLTAESEELLADFGPHILQNPHYQGMMRHFQ